jgi:hypothetical protein
MKTLITLSLALICLSSNAQTFIDKKDDFTGKQIKGAVVVFGKSIAPVGMTLTFGVNNGQKFIAFLWNAKSGQFGAFNNLNPKDLSILLKMDNDTIYRFKADTAVSNVINFGSSSNMIIASKITDTQLLALSAHIISIFRVGIKGDNGVDLDNSYLFTDRNKRQVQKAAAYMIDMQILPDDDSGNK